MLSMSWPCKLALYAFVIGVTALSTVYTANAQHGGSEQLIRVVWQDAKDKSLHWGEFLQVGPSIVFQNQGKVSDFPNLTGNQRLGTMERIDNLLVLGVRRNCPQLAEVPEEPCVWVVSRTASLR